MSRAVGHSGGAAPTPAGVRREPLERIWVRAATVRTAYDLDRHHLRATERAIRGLARHSMAPTANAFWETTAVPRARRLVDESQTVIDEELPRLAATTDHDDDGADRADAVVAAALGPVGIHDLGRWWQRRLRRAARVHALPAILLAVPGDAELAVSNQEMALLDVAPWCHGDRLLSAFELANGEIERFARRRFAELFGPVTSSRRS